MNTRKCKALLYSALTVLFALFNIVGFILPMKDKYVFFTAYGFTCTAFAIQVLIWTRSLSDIKRKFPMPSSVYIGITYLIVQLTAFFILVISRPYADIPIGNFIIKIRPVGIGETIIICSSIFCFFAIRLLLFETGYRKVESTGCKRNDNSRFLNELRIAIETAAVAEHNPELKETLSKLSDKIKYSDPISSPALSDIENEITEKVKELKNGTNDKSDIVKRISDLLSVRNTKCKLLKE